MATFPRFDPPGTVCEYCGKGGAEKYRGAKTGKVVVACNPDHAKAAVTRSMQPPPPSNGPVDVKTERDRAEYWRQLAATMDERGKIIKKLAKEDDTLLSTIARIQGGESVEFDPHFDRNPLGLSFPFGSSDPTIDWLVKSLPENAGGDNFQPIGNETLDQRFVLPHLKELHKLFVTMINSVHQGRESLNTWATINRILNDIEKWQDSIRRNPTLWSEHTDERSMMSRLPRDIVREVDRYDSKRKESPGPRPSVFKFPDFSKLRTDSTTPW